MKREKIVFIIGLISILIGSIVSVSAVTYLYNANEVSYDNSTSHLNSTDVQGAINELYDAAQDYSSMNTRTTALENKWKNNSYSYFDAPSGYEYLNIKNPTAGKDRGISIYDANNVRRGDFYYDPSSEAITIDARTSSGNAGTGTLNLNAANGVKINGSPAGKRPVSVNSDYLFTSSTTFSYTGASVTIPANSYYSLTFLARYYSDKPQEIGVSNSSTNYDELASALTGHHTASTSLNGKTGSSAGTFYVWTKYPNANTNKVQIRGFYIPE